MFPIQHRPSESTGFSPLQSPLVSSPRRSNSRRRIQERNFFNKIKISWYVQRQVEGIEFWSGRGKTGLDKSHFEIYHRGQQLSFWLHRGRCCGRSIFFSPSSLSLSLFSPLLLFSSLFLFSFFWKTIVLSTNDFETSLRGGRDERFWDYLDESYHRN